MYKFNNEVKNVLFYFYREGVVDITVKSGDLCFQPVAVQYLTEEKSNYIRIK